MKPFNVATTWSIITTCDSRVVPVGPDTCNYTICNVHRIITRPGKRMGHVLKECRVTFYKLTR